MDLETTQTQEVATPETVETTEVTTTQTETTPENTNTEVATPETVTQPENSSVEVVTEPVVDEPRKPFTLPTATEETVTAQELTPEQVAAKFKDNKAVLLKALGYDDFAAGVLDYYEKTGDLTPYLEVKTVDYSKVPDEKIVEQKLREQYATQGLTPEEISLLVEDEMSKRYQQDPELFSEREVQLGAIRRKAEAAEFRKQLTERQAQFKAPERVQETPTAAPTYEQQVEAARTELIEDAAVQQFFKAKTIQFGGTENPYSLPVQNPEETLSVIYDTNRYIYHIAEKNEKGEVIMKDGKPVMNRAKMLKIASYVANMETIEKNLIAHGESLGKKKLIEESENVNDNRSSGATTPVEDVWSALNRKLQGK